MARKLRVGDRVNVVDGSYAFGIKNGKYYGNISNNNRERYNLVVVNVGLDVDTYCEETKLDLLVTDGHGNFWFVLSNGCKLIPQMHKISIGDKEFEISDESYEAFKKQFQS